MIFSYKYPVVKFFGDDPEDTEVTEKAGSIKTINHMKLSYLRKDHSFISSLEAIKTDHSYVYPDGIQDVNFPIWMMYFGIMNPFLGVMNSSDMKMPQR